MIKDITPLNTIAHQGLLIFATAGLHRVVFGETQVRGKGCP